MAKKNSTGADRKVLVLVDCALGKSGEVISLSAADADDAVASGACDDNAAAVAAHEG